MVLTQALALLSIATCVAGIPSARRAVDGLNNRAVANGMLYFGTATDNPELTDAPYVAGLSNTADFGQVTVGNAQKWDATEPSRGVFSYTKGDEVAKLVSNNGQKLRCHTLVWHSQLPSWVSSGGFDNATLISIMKNHITNVATHYKGKCLHWDVVNEALNEDGTFRSSVFYDTIGPAYIPIAFAAAAAADPNAKLYYNDYNLDGPGAKSTAAQNIVKMIKSFGAKIDGVGSQGHLIVGSTPSKENQVANMNAFVNLGVEFAITELDIRADTPITSQAYAQQTKDFAATIGACAAVKKCVGVTIWDYTDKYSWIPSVFKGQGSALPWDENLQKKPEIYDAILSALGPSTSQSTSASSTTASPTAQPSTAGKWEQCGGIGWTGPTVCVSGSACIRQNDWYSQCQ